MKNEVMKIVKNALSGAEDNLHRANMQFGKMSDKQLSENYGKSEQTCGEILEDCRGRKAELERCVKWVDSVI